MTNAPLLTVDKRTGKVRHTGFATNDNGVVVPVPEMTGREFEGFNGVQVSNLAMAPNGDKIELSSTEAEANLRPISITLDNATTALGSTLKVVIGDFAGIISKSKSLKMPTANSANQLLQNLYASISANFSTITSGSTAAQIGQAIDDFESDAVTDLATYDAHGETPYRYDQIGGTFGQDTLNFFRRLLGTMPVLMRGISIDADNVDWFNNGQCKLISVLPNGDLNGESSINFAWAKAPDQYDPTIQKTSDFSAIFNSLNGLYVEVPNNRSITITMLVAYLGNNYKLSPV